MEVRFHPIARSPATVHSLIKENLNIVAVKERRRNCQESPRNKQHVGGESPATTRGIGGSKMKRIQKMKNTCGCSPQQKKVTFSINAQDARALAVKGMKQILMGFVIALSMILTQPLMAAGPAAVNLLTAGDFVILAKSAVSTTGTTAISGDIGLSPAAASYITGFGLVADSSNTFSTSSLVTGKIYAANYTPPTPAKMTTAVSNMEAAYTDAAGRATPDYTELYSGDLTGRTLVPGLYKWSSGVLISAGGVTISGSATDVWIFQIAQDLTLSSGAAVTLSGGAKASNIFWQVAGKVTIGTTAAMKGIILCQTNIAMSTGASLNGRALAQTAVTLIANAVTDDPSQKSITSFKILGGGTVDEGAKTVAVTVPFSTNLTTLVPTIGVSPLATVSPLSGIPYDFTNPVVYTVTANDSSTQAYTVTVVKSAASSEKAITSFKILGDGIVNEVSKTVAVTVPFSTNLTTLVPTISVSPLAAASPLSGVAQDFTVPQTYTVTAEDSSTQAYTVTVVKSPASSEKTITSFKILGNGTVDEVAKTVAVTVPLNTNLTALVPTISVSPLATVNPLSGVVQNFTNPVLYPVTAEDSSTQNYTVTVFKSSSSTLAPINLGSTINFAILAGAAITSTGGGIINGDVGASPIAGSAIGVPAAQVNGIIYAVDASGPAGSVVDPVLLTAAKGDLTIAYNDAAGRTPVPTGPFLNPNGGNLGGLNLVPGLYKFTSTALITGSDVTLTGGPDDVWIFQIASDLQLGSGIKVILAGGAQPKNIFWQVGTSAVLGTSSVFKGTIMADQSITMDTSSTMEGRALAFSGEVVFNGNGTDLPVSDGGGMYLAKMKGSINWAKHATGISDDRLNISGMINPRGGNSKLTGATAVLRVSGIQLLPAVAMDSSGKASGVTDGITYKFKFDWLHGSYSFDLKGLDLRTAIGVPNATGKILYDLPLRLTIEGAGLDIPLVIGTFECPCSTKVDKVSNITFNSTSNITLTGLYNCNKTQVNQQKQQGGDVFNVKVTGVIEADGGGQVVPNGDITIKIGDATSVIIFAQMTGNGAKWTYKGKSPGITSFIIDNKKHTFTLAASKVAGTGIPLNVAGAPTSYQMQIQLQVPTAVETMIFDNTVEILRKNSTSKTWNR